MGMKNKGALVSILIPVYNIESYVERAVDSAVEQTYRNIEIVLVDDGSDDGSGNICDMLANKYSNVDIKVIHKENGGLISARKTAVHHAAGEYIAFLDGDDWIDKDYIEKLMEGFDASDIDITIGGATRDYAAGKPEKLYKPSKNMTMDVEDTLFQMLSCEYFTWTVWGKIYKKDIFNIDTVDERIVAYEDLLINWNVITRCKKTYYMNLCGYHYFFRDESIMGSSFNISQLTELDVYRSIGKSINTHKENIQRIYIRMMQRGYAALLTGMYLDYEKYKKLIEKYQNQMKELLTELRLEAKEGTELFLHDTEYIIRNLKETKHRLDAEIESIDEDKTVYIYGAGKYGKKVAEYLNNNRFNFRGFIVSEGIGLETGPDGIHKIFSFEEVKGQCNNVFIIAIKRSLADSVTDILKKNSAEYITLDDYNYLIGIRSI